MFDFIAVAEATNHWEAVGMILGSIALVLVGGAGGAKGGAVLRRRRKQATVNSGEVHPSDKPITHADCRRIQADRDRWLDERFSGQRDAMDRLEAGQGEIKASVDKIHGRIDQLYQRPPG